MFCNVRIGIIFVLLAITANAALAQQCRNPAVKHKFDVSQGFPHGRKGYVVDHVCALAVGGLDIVRNMQYQTIADGKQKDKIENTRKGRDLFCNATNSLPYRTVYNCRK